MVQTRVGYAGGETSEPTYRNIQDHAEAIRVVYDPKTTSFASLLERYRGWHSPRRSMGQYRSILFPANRAEQGEVEDYLQLLVGETAPEIVPAGSPAARFWDAEDYHQKYRLRRNQALVSLLEIELGNDWDQHEVATKLNAGIDPSFDASPWLEQLSAKARKIFRVG